MSKEKLLVLDFTNNSCTVCNNTKILLSLETQQLSFGTCTFLICNTRALGLSSHSFVFFIRIYHLFTNISHTDPEIYMYIPIMIINVCYFVLCLMTIQILDFKSIKSLTLTLKQRCNNIFGVLLSCRGCLRYKICSSFLDKKFSMHSFVSFNFI